MVNQIVSKVENMPDIDSAIDKIDELTYNETEKDIIYLRNLKVYDGEIKFFRLYGMNKMGQDGWELVASYVNDRSRNIYHFKRKIGD